MHLSLDSILGFEISASFFGRDLGIHVDFHWENQSELASVLFAILFHSFLLSCKT